MGLETTAYVLSGLTVSGGVAGFTRTGSVISLVAGCSVGFLYGLGGYRIQNKQPYGVEICLLASAILAAASIPRAIRLRKPVPIALSLVSTFGAVTFGGNLAGRGA